LFKAARKKAYKKNRTRFGAGEMGWEKKSPSALPVGSRHNQFAFPI